MKKPRHRNACWADFGPDFRSLFWVPYLVLVLGTAFLISSTVSPEMAPFLFPKLGTENLNFVVAPSIVTSAPYAVQVCAETSGAEAPSLCLACDCPPAPTPVTTVGG